MSETVTAYIGLGSNLGDRASHINKAVAKLSDCDGIGAVRISDIIQTAPLSDSEQPDFLNAVAEVKTTLSAEQLYRQMIDIETSLGRARGEKWSPRTIDLDLLLFAQNVINQPGLVVPHPQMHLRSFVLNGLNQLNSDLLHPVIEEPIGELAARLNGSDFVLNADVPQLICLAGIIGVGKTTLAGKLAQELKSELLLEAYDTNPFMPQVYAGRKELALDSQLYFLTSRFEQLGPGVLRPGQIVVSDYIFAKEFIYAKRLLDTDQQILYKKISHPLVGMVTKPVLVIYLTEASEICLQRIHKRNRSFEQGIELKFLDALSADYYRLFADWTDCPVIRISASKFDLTKPQGFSRLADEIKFYIAA